MKPEDRRSINNGIYLCVACSIKIDRDIAAYPASKLHAWKRSAEERARAQHSQRYTPEADAQKHLAAIFSASSGDFLPNAIGNTHRAMVAALEAADPRFAISTTYDGHTTQITLDAKEDVPLAIEMPAELWSEWSRQMQLLMEEGRTLEVSSEGIRMVGSSIFEKMDVGSSGQPSKMTLTPLARPARLKLKLVQESSGRQETLDDVTGSLRGGSEAAIFEGSLFDGLIDITLRFNKDGGDSGHQFSLVPDPDRWKGLLVTELPYFEYVDSLVERLVEGWSLEARMEMGGKFFAKIGMNVPTDPSAPVADVHALLRYTELARKLSARLGRDIRFDVGNGLSSREFEALARAVAMAEGAVRLDATSMRSNPTSQFVATNGVESIDKFRDRGETVYRFEFAPEAVMVFHQAITVPAIEIVLGGVTAQVSPARDATSVGDVVTVEWVPGKNFNGWMGYCIPASDTAA